MNLTVLLAFFLLPMIAGTVVKALRPDASWMRMLLSFSGAFLLGVVFMHMLPELYEEEGELIGAWILGGFLLQVILEYFSHGIEHGHVHLHATGAKAIPVMTLLSLCIHSFVEGIPFADPKVAADLPFLAGVVLHKMPMAIALAAVLLRSGTGQAVSWALLTVFALSAPFGMILGAMVGNGSVNGFLHLMLGLAIGMLLHISTTIIFESAPDHRLDRQRFLAVVMGIAMSAMVLH